MFQKVTRQDVLDGILPKLRETYGSYIERGARLANGTDPAVTIQAVAALPRPLQRDAVREAMDGWPDWTDNRCDECHADRDVLIRIGDEPDYDARWVDLCADCLRKASKLAKSNT